MFDYMNVKVDNMLSEERMCCLTLDEMSIQSAVVYDITVGDITVGQNWGMPIYQNIRSLITCTITHDKWPIKQMEADFFFFLLHRQLN